MPDRLRSRLTRAGSALAAARPRQSPRRRGCPRVRRDEVRTIDIDDNTWDAVRQVATSVDSGGWTAEYRIPFSQLRFRSVVDQVWGIQFERIIGRSKEYDISTFSPKSERGGVPRYGLLTGLHALQSGKRLELLP